MTAQNFKPSAHSHKTDLAVPVPPYGNDVDLLITEEPPSVAGKVIGIATLLAGGTAAAISYKRNQSILWALGTWMIWPAALPYYLVINKEG